MSKLPGYIHTSLRYVSLVILLMTLGRSCVQAQQQDNGVSKEFKTPKWWPIAQCIVFGDFQKCLQDQTLRSTIGLDRQGDIEINTEDETVKMPGGQEEGIIDMIGDLVTEGLSRFLGDSGTETGDNNEADDDDDDDDDDVDDESDKDGEFAGEVETSENGDKNISMRSASSRTDSLSASVQRNMETGRGKKKKKKKQKRRTIIKLILLVVLIKLKILKFLYVFGKFMQFKLVLLVGINTIINVIRLFMEFKKKKEHPVVYYEQAHHQHHYDEHHHVDPLYHEDDDKGWLGGLWSRTGPAQSTEHAHDIAYRAQKPNYDTQRPAISSYSTIN